MSREAMKLALEVMQNQGDVSVDEWIAAEKALQKALANEALDKMAENARELGLDYEPWTTEQVTVPTDSIQFFKSVSNGPSVEVLRISKDGIWANPDIPTDEAAKKVLETLDRHINGLVKREREAGRQEPVAKHYANGGHLVYPTAQRPWVEVEQVKWEGDKLLAKLKENT